MAKTNYISMKW